MTAGFESFPDRAEAPAPARETRPTIRNGGFFAPFFAFPLDFDRNRGYIT